MMLTHTESRGAVGAAGVGGGAGGEAGGAAEGAEQPRRRAERQEPLARGREEPIQGQGRR